MNQEEWNRVQPLVEAALKRDPEERAAFLDAACADRPSLRAAVESLLTAHAEEAEGSTSVTPRHPPASAGGRPDRGAPQTIGPYLIRHEIARGGMGVVYLAEDTRLSRRVALKALPAMTSPDPSARERLRREARAAAALSHPGIATVYALEEIGDQLFLASEYVPGQTLRSLIRSGPLAPLHILDLGTQLAYALAAAHALGIVHRDLKPENIILGPTGQAKVLDFGIARMENLTSSRLTETGVIVGTPGYMAPEQAQGFDVDFRTDLFSFGVLLYEMTTGSNPFEARTATATIARILQVEPQPLSSVRPDGPAGLDRIVDRCLQKQPADRYASTQEVVAALEALLGDGSVRRDETARRRQSGAARADARSALTPRGVITWWRTHQVAAMVLYIVVTTWSWRLGEWYRTTIPPWIFVGIGAGSMLAGVMRGHLLFTERFNGKRMLVERQRTSRPLTAIDLLISALLFADGIFTTAIKPTFSLLTMSLALAIGLSRLLIEPATSAAAFGQDGGKT